MPLSIYSQPVPVMAERPSSPLLALDKLEGQLTCPVCLDQYDNPKTLPCLHSFCLKCIQQLPLKLEGDKKLIDCPSCRTEVSNGVEDLRSAFFINNLLEVQPVLKKVLTKQKAMNCSIHDDEPLKVYCETCQTLICHDCTISAHKNHDYHLVKDVFPQHLEEIKCALGHLRQKASATTDNITAIGKRESEIKDHEKVLRKDVDSYVQRLIELLRASQQEMVERMHTIVEKKLKLLAQQKKEAEIALEQLQSCAEYVEQCLQHGSNQQVLMEKTKMVDRMKQMNEQTDTSKFEPQEKPDFMFSKDSSLSEKAHNIGYIFSDGRCTLDVDFTVFPMVNREATATVLANVHKDKEVDLVISNCYITSVETNHTMVCDVDESDGEVSVCFTPCVSGNHHITVASNVAPAFSLPFHVLPSPESRKVPVKIIQGLAKPLNIAVSKDGVIAVVEGGAHCVTLVDRAGKRTSFGSKGTGDGQLNNPRGIAFSSDGHILVTDDHRLHKFTSSGQHLMSFGSKKKGSGPQQFNTPMGIAVHPTTGDIYIADCYNHRIQVVSDDLSQLRSFGAKGSSASQLKYPTDLSFSLGGVLYVNDSGNHRIEVFDYRGNSTSSYTCCDKLKDPKSLAVDPCNNVYIIQKLMKQHPSCSGTLPYSYVRSYISCYTADGQLSAYIGNQEECMCVMCMDYHSIAMDKLGSLYVSDTNNDRLVIM